MGNYMTSWGCCQLVATVLGNLLLLCVFMVYLLFIISHNLELYWSSLGSFSNYNNLSG